MGLCPLDYGVIAGSSAPTSGGVGITPVPIEASGTEASGVVGAGSFSSISVITGGSSIIGSGTGGDSGTGSAPTLSVGVRLKHRE